MASAAKWLRSFTLATGLFSGAAFAQTLPDASYKELPRPSSPNLKLEEGFHAQSGFIFDFGHSADPSLNGIARRSFFCPGKTIASLKECFALLDKGRISTGDVGPAGNRITSYLHIVIGEDQMLKSRLEGNPSEDTMKLVCPSDIASDVKTLTPKEKAEAEKRLKSGEIKLFSLPDVFENPSGYVLPDGSKLVILKNASNWAEKGHPLVRGFHVNPDGTVREIELHYHDGRSSHVTTPDGIQRPGFETELGTLAVPSVQEEVNSLSSGMPATPTFDGQPVQKMTNDALSEMLALMNAEKLFPKALLRTPCFPDGPNLY
jgi:hypothetical protein